MSGNCCYLRLPSQNRMQVKGLQVACMCLHSSFWERFVSFLNAELNLIHCRCSWVRFTTSLSEELPPERDRPIRGVVGHQLVMVAIRQWLLLTALLSLSLSNGEHSQDDVDDVTEEDVDISDKAFLLVRHKIDTIELVQGRNTSVVVELYNAGNRYEQYSSNRHLTCFFYSSCTSQTSTQPQCNRAELHKGKSQPDLCHAAVLPQTLS